MDAPQSESLGWRENGVEHDSPHQLEQRRMEAARNKIIKTVQVKYPKQTMRAKALVLNDLVSKVANRKAATKDDYHIRNAMGRLHHVQKPKTPPNLTSKLTQSHLKSRILSIISQESNSLSRQKIRVGVSCVAKDMAKLNCHESNVAQDMAKLSCYDNTPREPSLNERIADSETPDPQPDVTQRLENIGLGRDTVYNNVVSTQIPQPVCEDLCQQIVTTKIRESGMIQPQIHDFSSRFREYCSNTIKPELNSSLELFVADLSRLQRNLYKRDNTRGRCKRRYYAGFKEIERRLQLKKIKLSIVAPDLDTNKNEGELDKMVKDFIESCRINEVPVIFGLSRRKLGYLTHGKGFVSCIGIANYEALEDKLEDVLIKVIEARNQFRCLKNEVEKKIDVTNILTDDLLISERVKLLLRTLATC